MEEDKISIKLAELSLKKFNENAVPNCLGLLKNHKSNIVKCLALGDWEKIKKEEINATRIVKQLKNILYEMDTLRSRIRDEDVGKFDQITSKSRENAMEAIREYLDLQLRTPDKSMTRTNTFEDDDISGEVLAYNVPRIQTTYEMSEHQLKSQQACLEEFENLQREVEDLYSLYQQFGGHVEAQKEYVEHVAKDVEVAAVNVVQGESNLRQALKYQKTMYPICGALIGTCIGGPVGFFVGLKAGGLAAIGCGLLGFTGGAALKHHEDKEQLPHGQAGVNDEARDALKED